MDENNNTESLVVYVLFCVFFVVINIPFINALLLAQAASFSVLIFIAVLWSYYFYWSQEKRWFLFKILFCFLIFNLAFVVGWLATPWPTPYIQDKERCLTYLSEGVLYDGQPYCHQGPMIYIVGKIIQHIPGEEEVNFQISSLALLALLFFSLCDIKKKITSDSSLLFFVTFFVVFFVRIAEDDFASIIAIVFLMVGFYSLFISRYMHKEIIGGFFLGFTVLSKIYFLLPIFAIICFYIYPHFKEKEKREIFLSIVKIIVPILSLIILTLIIFPNFILYYYTVHTYHDDVVPFQEAIRVLLDFRYIHNGLFLLFYIGIVISILRVLHKKTFDLSSFVCSVVFFTLFVLMVKEFYITKISETYRYFFAIMPFYVINLYLFRKEYSEFHKILKIIAGILLIACIFVFWQAIGGIMFQDILDGSIFHEQKLILKIQKEIAAPLFELPKQSGKVLVSKDYSALFQDNNAKNPFTYLNATDFELIEEQDPYLGLDLAYVHGLVNMGLFELKENRTMTVNVSQINASLRNFSYPIIIVSWHKDILSSLLLENNAYFKNSEKTYCGAAIAVLPGGYGPVMPTRFIVFFLDHNLCNEMKIKVSEYYSQNFDYFCKRGKFTASIISSVEECNTFIKTTEYMIPDHFKALYLSFFIIIFLLNTILFHFLCNTHANKCGCKFCR